MEDSVPTPEAAISQGAEGGSITAPSRGESVGPPSEKRQAKCVIVLGMAGSGKTTFIRQLNGFLHMRNKFPYLVNLDPAVNEVPYPANIDIRDTVKYKDVMKEYGLGPNGAIMTSLNVFATRFDQVLQILSKRKSEYDYVLIDTPGQIEVFTWSASGTIISESLAAEFPTMIAYVMDIQRSTSPVTFVSNMLYACSILYKTKLPFVVVMNKTDIVQHTFAVDWMRDWTVFQEALSQETSYMGNLAQSLSLALDEFYCNLKCVGVSSLMGLGFDELLEKFAEAAEEYEKDYKTEYEKLRASKDKTELERQKKQLEKFMSDHKNKSTSQTSTENIDDGSGS